VVKLAVVHAAAAVTKELVLLGGGHSHVAVLKMFGMSPMPGTRITLVSKDDVAPYSGMLPGLIAGHYTHDEAHIDLRKLCRFANAQFYRGEVSGLDLQNKRVLCHDRPPIAFDLLSINVGSTPRAHDVPGAAKFTVPVKPVDQFLARWPKLIEEIRASKSEHIRIAIVGGGAGGVELTLSTQRRLRKELPEKSAALEFHLVTDTDTLLPTHNARVQEKFTRILRERAVQVHLTHRVVAVEPKLLVCKPGQPVPFDICFWVTSAAAPSWIAQAGLAIDERGFAAVNETLQSTSHPFVFAAGDVAGVAEHPRPKSGVFAVRQGKPLAENLRRALAGDAPQAFKPQRQFLSLISTGNKYAVASRGPFACEGEWVWRWKDHIDRKWMRQYQELPAMSRAASGNVTNLNELRAEVMRCGGCGAKVGSVVLARVLARLPQSRCEDILVGLDAPDDAAVIAVPPGKVSVQTVDFFRALVNDPYVFGQIAANHALNDIYAMGAQPHSALAIAVVPYAAEHIVEEQLFQLLSGAVAVFDRDAVALAGGHSAEGAELALGFSVNGFADAEKLLRKSGMRPVDKLILTKPLGTGTLFAAEMRGAAKGKWIERAIASMLASNREASAILQRHGATACTDVTGFGLLGHALEMARASKVSIELRLADLPLLDGAIECVQAGILSTLHPDNLRSKRAIANANASSKLDRFPILFDPQTAGGLLTSVSPDRAGQCLSELQQNGYAHAAIIGHAAPLSSLETPISVN
jgi:selenide,water dikinase